MVLEVEGKMKGDRHTIIAVPDCLARVAAESTPSQRHKPKGTARLRARGSSADNEPTVQRTAGA